MAAIVTEFMRFYNQERIHGSLGYRSPLAFQQVMQMSKEQDVKVRCKRNVLLFVLDDKAAIPGDVIQGDR